MMNNRIYLVFVIALMMFTLPFIFGCGKYIERYSSPVVISKYPLSSAGGIGSEETIWVKFSKAMDTSGFSFSEFGNKFIISEMTATATFYATPTPEVYWTDEDTKLVIKNVFFIANPGNRVRILASLEAFSDTEGKFVPEDTVLWDYTLSGLNIVSRSPTIDAIDIPNDVITLEAIFNDQVNTSSFNSMIGPAHTAGSPLSTSAPIWSNNDTTLTIEVGGWTTSPSVVDLTYEAMDVYGNVVTNGQLWKFTIQ